MNATFISIKKEDEYLKTVEELNNTLKSIYPAVDIRVTGRESQPYFKTACQNIALPQNKHGSINFGSFQVKMELKRFLYQDPLNANQCFVKL